MSDFPADKAARIQLLVLDVDGVLTDGRLYYDAQGREQKVFHVRDGYGIKRVREAGIDVAVISGRSSLATETRLAELNITHVTLGCDDKKSAIRELTKTLGHGRGAVACVGDDVPDIPMLEEAGLAIAVADACSEVAAMADWQTTRPGGHGAVREVCDRLIAARR